MSAVVAEFRIPYRKLVEQTGLGRYRIVNPYVLFAEETGRHVSGMFVRMVLKAKGANAWSTERDMRTRDTVIYFLRTESAPLDAAMEVMW